MEIDLAVTTMARLRGLLGRAPPRPLLIAPARSVHTCGMRFAIDAVFLDVELRVVKVARDVPPWRWVGARGARAVLELPAGGAADLRPGDRLRLRR